MIVTKKVKKCVLYLLVVDVVYDFLPCVLLIPSFVIVLLLLHWFPTELLIIHFLNIDPNSLFNIVFKSFLSIKESVSIVYLNNTDMLFCVCKLRVLDNTEDIPHEPVRMKWLSTSENELEHLSDKLKNLWVLEL
ncbi:hypothetical protein BD770DRAFT_415677 [Pilaira anomala]|nr:hypothetical protein BD770DRAFT_415677 [Pilaira anomala]